MSKLFDPNQPAGKILQDWWLELIDNRGERAELRRAKSVTDAALQPVTIRLITRLQPLPSNKYERIALIAVLAAQLKPEMETEILGTPPKYGDARLEKNSLPARMAKPKGDRMIVSELRFRRLLRYKTTNELYRPMIRILALLDHQANLFDLAESMYWWGDQIRKKDQIRKNWAFAYFPRIPDSSAG